ncbi:hypothetical protein QBC37DRAFT_80310 [Rhypophila decipiens]|uniref:FAD-binding PCMH-type domain-containing protein n=1 Tax=Rhypophila decipiens TaxID=261697 RepID=A0AAN6XX73_9PEZI|nr:hypothetical protein QBC37DRAFT_80310 [Rhypophila decipiens]
MAGFTLLRFVPVALSLATIAAAAPAPELDPILFPGGDKEAIPVCRDIESKVSSASKVIWPFHLGYGSALHHWFFSSSQNSTCAVEVGSARDLSTVVKIVGDTRTPFAIKSGGHASNPGFSSTPSVHISLEKMNQVILSADGKTVELGFGNTWFDVYKALESAGVNVVGGRVPGPGVGGFTLGGGYSWKTNQYGLTVDTVLSFDVVLPNGTFTRASASQNSDLFWALKGGTNRFGIVTSAVMETHPQPPKVYAGLAIYSSTQVPALLNATSRFFYENTDPKASIITTLEGSPLGTGATALLLFFYDGPNKPDSFKLFDDITPLVSTVKQQTFVQFLNGIPSRLGQVRNPRGAFITMSTSEISQRFVDVVNAEVQAVSKEMALHGGIVASFDIEPFTPYGEHATDSSYPHTSSPLPLNAYFSWISKFEDEWWWARMRQSIDNITAQAKAEGIYVNAELQPAYPNYSLFDEPVENMYGPTNTARLRAVRQKYDPERVMDLAGGFDI